MGSNFRGSVFVSLINHPLTNVTLAVTVRKGSLLIETVRLHLSPVKKRTGKIRKSDNPELKKVNSAIIRFLDGTIHDLSKVPIDLSWCTPFVRSVLVAARRIPWGKVVSYGELAKQAGYPRAVRATASVMRSNRFPLIVPCHRVVRSDGTIGGFMGKTSGPPVEMKRKLIDRERILQAIAR